MIESDSILMQVLENNQYVTAFYIEARVSIFDPEAFFPLDEKSEQNFVPYEISEKSFNQRIVFIRDEFLALETIDDEENTLHIYTKEIGGRHFSHNFTRDRVFTDEDVMLPDIIFYTKHATLMKAGLYEMGIAPMDVKIEHERYNDVYQLGQDDENIKVDPDGFKILEINRQIQILGRYYPLNIKFLNWDSVSKRIPQRTQMYINNRLFKEINISHLKFRGITAKRNRFIRKYRKFLPPKPSFSLETNYSR